MELKEYFAIFKKHFWLFLFVIAMFVTAGALFQLFHPLSYKSSLTLNVTRIGAQQTGDYKYDDFYRLQADERFADTVVRWLGSPRVAVDIYNESKITTEGLSSRKLSRIFKARRLSSQVIEVSYVTKDIKTAQGVAGAVVKVINQETEKLNELQKEESWFTIAAEEPVIRENKWPWEIVILFSALIGIFVGCWAVLIRYYIKN
jgi:uncharacterized protein involved in exopolysaccharide biosynthesis